MSDSKRLLEAQIAEDQNSARITFNDMSEGNQTLDVSFQQLSDMIAALGQIRAAMRQSQPYAPIEGAQVNVTFNTPWFTQLDPLSERSVIAFQHAAYGPVGLLLDAADADKLGRLLLEQGKIPRQSASAKPS